LRQNLKKKILDVKSWSLEEEIRESKYARNLVQLDNGVRIPSSGWKCQMCDITTNLWINLTDGFIGCGRKQPDLSGFIGGNEHSLHHFMETSFPLAVKLGTITGEGADVYSYMNDENDLVIDPLINKHLSHFGIEMNNMKKTEKSMAELELELQFRPEYFRVTEDNAQLVRLYGPGLTGLENIGNSCYMNSVLQVMFSIPEFTERYYNNSERFFSESENPPEDFHVQFSKIACGLLSGDYSHYFVGDYEKHIRPTMFKKVAATGNRDFSTGQQQDALEYFQYLLTQIERKEHAKGEGQNPSDIFTFEFEERIECFDSHKVKYMKKKDNCITIPVPIEKAKNIEEVRIYKEKMSKKSKEQILEEKSRGIREESVLPIVSFQDCLEALIEPEEIYGFYSTAVKRQTKAIKTTRLSNFPKYLIFKPHLFTNGEGWTPIKLECEIIVPEEIDINWLKGRGKLDHEELLPDENEETVDKNLIEQITAMGFSDIQAENALYATKGDVAEAINWIMGHLDDPKINEPRKKSKPSKSSVFVNESFVLELSQMGFSTQKATLALQNTNNDMNRAVEWLFSHPDDEPTFVEPEINQGSSVEDGSGEYELFAFVNHIGSNVQSGHYICHIKKEGKWVKYNDEKVEESKNPPIQFGYIYFFRRKN